MTARKQPKPQACPLPGCGHKPIVRRSGKDGEFAWLVRCYHDGTAGHRTAYGPTRSAAIALWNGKKR